MDTTILQSMIRAIAAEKPHSRADFLRLVKAESGRYHIDPPTNIDLRQAYHILTENHSIERNEILEGFLMKRLVRTHSGVAVISVLTKPMGCPHACLYCPNEPNVPKSYLSNEPAVMRAIACDYDPHAQVTARLRSLREQGHETEKCELIVIGGTWSAHPHEYQEWFLTRCFDAFNEQDYKSLADAQLYNETAIHRVVGLTLETRPDYITPAEIARMRMLGCTKVEIGVQSTHDDVLAKNNRGHGTEEVRTATRLLKQAGFKVLYHMMPNLPSSTPEYDKEDYIRLFTDEGYQPDMMKIYPCVLTTHNAKLKALMESGDYIPYDADTLIEILIAAKRATPPYVRIVRVIRDIPTTSITHGNHVSNLREYVGKKLNEAGTPCRCIRCREPKQKIHDPDDLELVVRSYPASGGVEYFLSYEGKDGLTLYSFCRLRIPQTEPDNTVMKLLPELTSQTALIRELHTYGTALAISKDQHGVQHSGLGSRLMQKAEEIAKDAGCDSMAVIAGIGAREYYKNVLGYVKKGTYMCKNF